MNESKLSHRHKKDFDITILGKGLLLGIEDALLKRSSTQNF